MFTFHWSELCVIVIGGLILLIGLALLMLRRRNDLLTVFLTPEEPNIEEEFFRVRKKSEPQTDNEPAADNESEKPPGQEP